MKISMIAAMAHNRVIGKNNDMPWHMPADLAHFKRVTLGKPIVMGRNTYESIGRALPGRLNIVITSNASYELPDATVVHSIEEAIVAASEESVEELMIIGGGQIYTSVLPKADRLYLTHIDLDVEGDTFFPDYEAGAVWQEVATEVHQSDEKNPHNYSFVTLDRVR